jgi:CBS domain containing-hemolysin-like protein
MFTFVLLRVLAVLLLVAANAFFVAAEFSLVSIRDTRIEQLIESKRIGARTIRKLHRKLDEVLNGVQLGVTMASLALGWLGESALARVLEQPFGHLPHAHIYAHGVAIAAAFGLITYFHVILGEVVPKSVSLQQAERVALAVAKPLDVFMTIFSPLLKFMAGSSRLVLRLFGTRELRAGGVHSAEELKMIVTASRRFGLIPLEQEELIHRALELEGVTVREVMVPRIDIFSLPADMPLEEAMKRVVEEQHSRVPVYDPQRGSEAIVGVLYSKDLMRWMQFRLTHESDEESRRRTGWRVRHVMRDVLVVPETKTLPDLLLEFKQRKRHLAVVVDEFGSTAGIVTVEDVIEQLVGEIEDEYDIAPPALVAGPKGLVLEGSTNIRDLESQYQLRLPRDEGFETLAGFVMTTLQRIPKENDSFEFGRRRYTVERMEGNRVEAVRIEQLDSAKEEHA